MLVLFGLINVIHRGSEIPPAEFNYTKIDDYNDIFNYLRQQFETDNLTTVTQVTVSYSSFYGDVSTSDRKHVDTILFHPNYKPAGRFLSKDEPKEQRPWVQIELKEVRLTVKSYSILYFASISRWMRCYSIEALDQTGDWTVLHKVTNEDTKTDHPHRNYTYYHYDVDKIGTYSSFRIYNDCEDSYEGAPWHSPHANMVSLSKILFYGRVEGGRVMISPIKLARSSEYILNLGMLAASEV